MEEWRDIKGYEGLYQVSNLGRIKSLNYNHICKEKILKKYKNKYGYECIGLSNNGNRIVCKVHRLVAQAFIPNIDNKPEVDHINTIRDDNRAENLKWVTRKENRNNTLTKEHLNTIYQTQDFREKMSKAKKGKKLSEESKQKLRQALQGINSKKIYCIELDKIFNSMVQCEKELGLNHSHISQVCQGKRKTTGGYHFRYVEEENKNNGNNCKSKDN